MRKHVLLLVSVAAMLLTSMFSKAQTVYFTDGFENGLKSEWTQEYYDVVLGQWVTETPNISQPWKAESASTGLLDYPSGAARGKGRAYFRQEAAPGKNVQTTGYRTRLITPKMNLTGYQPILRFYHAQSKWTADFDTLRVYYRLGNEDWELLEEYTSAIQKWKFEEMDLPRTGADYQIAFEANENMGRGIVLDSVIIRTKPQITQPHDLSYYDMRDNGVNVTWNASKDADYFRVVIAEMDLDLNLYPNNMVDSAKYVLVDSLMDSDWAQDIRVNNLVGGRTYYVQVQSIGEFENSAWSNTFAFRMKPVEIISAEKGYFEDFYLKYTTNEMKDQRLESWTWGGAPYGPVIPLWVGQEYFDVYSPDGSEAVAFVGQKTSSSGVITYSIGAGQYEFLISPEISCPSIDNFSMAMCHVTFWGTTYTYQHNRAKSIIVGIVSDPEDPTTFVPVDTCEVWGYKQFTYFDVDLSSYTGNGRYVAFVSNFQDKENWFALDKVTIELKPAISPVNAKDIRVIPDTTAAEMSWPAVSGATSYKLRYMEMPSKGSAVPLGLKASDMDGAITVPAPSNASSLGGLKPRTKYVYSVQAVGAEGSSTWSQPREFYTSAEISLPKKYEFEESEGRYTREGAGESANEYYPRDWCVFTNDADAPYLYTSYYRSGSRCLYLVKDLYNDAWTVAPMVEDVTQVEITFYARLSSTSYPNSSVIVGVMEDPSDLSTFTPINTLTLSSDVYERFYVNFTNYKGTGKYIALLWGDSGTSKNALCIDDLTIRPLASCFAPTMDIAQLTDSSATLSWSRPDGSYRYNIKISKVAIVEEQIADATGEALVAEYPAYDGSSLELKGLDYSTTYYVYAQTVCSETDKSDWASTSFTTLCPEKMSLPYKNDFESENYSGSNSIPSCWLKPTWSTTTSVYPYLTTSYNHDESGEEKAGNCLYMYSTTSYGSTIALPKLDGDLENVKLRFWAKYSSSGYKIMAGVMNNTNDPTDFYAVDTFETSGGQWVLCEATFSSEDLKHGSYLALSSYTGASNYVYIDDIEVVNMLNAAPFNYKTVDAGTNFFEVKWSGKTTDKWKVIVSDTRYSLDGGFDPEDEIPSDHQIANMVVTTNGYKQPDGLTSLTWYYLYAKSTAGTEWSMDSIQTECTVWDPHIKKVEGFETDAAGNDIRSTTATMSTTTANVNYFLNAKVPECWTVGNVLDGTDVSKRNSSGYIPYICTDGVGSGADPTKLKYAENADKTYQYSAEGVNSLKVYSYRTTSETTNRCPAWAAMNKLDCSNEELKSLILTFDYQMAKSTAANMPAIVIGVMDDPTDLSTFTVLDSIPASQATGTGSHNKKSVEIALEQYNGTGRYIAFRGAYGVTSTFYLDNVSVVTSSCPNPKPSMSQITSSSAVVASGLRVDNSWKYIVTDSMYQPSVLDDGTMPAASHIVAQRTVEPQEFGASAPKMARIEGLAADMTYYVYAATLCDGDEMSSWKMVEFTTLCADVDAATWVGDFENDTTVSGYTPKCWTVGSLTAGAGATYIPYVVSTTRKEIMEDPAAAKVLNKTTGAVAGAKVLRLYAYGTASSVTSAGAYAITPGIKIADGKSLKDYQIMFKGYGTSAQSGYTTSTSYAHNLRVGMIDDPSDLSTMTILDTVAMPTNTQQCVVELSQYNGTGKYIIFLLEKEVPNYSQVYIYDIHMDLIPACKVPHGLNAESVSDKAVTLSWIGNASSYTVALSKKYYSDAEKAAGYLLNDSVQKADGIILKNATSESFTFDGLTPNSSYYFYVQGKCSESESSLWSYEALGVHTDCLHGANPVPYFTNFDKNSATGTGNYPDCWDGVQLTYDTVGTTQSYPYVYSTSSYSYSTPYSMYMYSILSSSSNTKCIAVAPLVEGDLNTYTVSLFGRQSTATATSYGKQLIVGYVTDASSQKQIAATFVKVGEIVISGTTHQYYSLDLSTLNANIPAGARLALKADPSEQDGLTAASKYANFYIDNFRLGPPVTCFAPKNVAFQNIGLTEAEVTFEPANESADSWEIKLTKAGGATQTLITTNTTYKFTNLEPSSSYSVIIRSACEGDYSEYTDPVSFSTKWKIDTYKWSFNLNEQGTISAPSKPGIAVATYAMHPALVSTGSLGTLNYSSNTTYLPYQVANTASLAYAEDKRDFVAGGDTARALRLYRYTSTSNIAYGDSAAVILPTIVNPTGKQISMDLRFGYAYASNHSTATYQNVVSNTYPKSFLCIGTVDSLATDLTSYQEITRVYAHPMIATDTLRDASKYGWMHYVHPLDMNLAGKQLVVMIQSPTTAYICIDNLAIEASEAFTTPVITSVGTGDTYATINWTGNASAYNIYVVDTAKADCGKYIPYIQDAPAACIRKIENVTGNSYKVTGLTASGNTYEFYVEDASKEDVNGAMSNRAFVTTVCNAIEVNGSYSYDFEPGPGYKMGANPSKSTADGFTFQWPTSTTAGDTVYKTPDCWNYGITYGSYDKTSTTYKSYNPTLRSNSMTAAAASRYRYARNGYSCMQFYGTSTYKEVYAVMPLFTGFDPDTMEINFWGRCTYEKVQGGTIAAISYLKGTSYSTKMAVGTMTDPEDPTTFVALDTIEYDYTANDMSTSTVASSDPMGNNFWLNFTVPLKGATGPYIAFKQVGYGYFYMDDLTIQKRQTARRPYDLEVVELGSTSAKVTWKGRETAAEGGKYIIQLSTSATNWESPQQFESVKDTIEFTGLEVSKQYFFRVQQAGSIYGNSDFAHYVDFTTECLALNPNGYKTSFECDDDTDPWMVIPGATGSNQNTMKQNQCWTYWNMGTTQTVSSTYFPYNIASTASTGYSHNHKQDGSGGYALKLNQYTTTAGATTYRHCVVSPEINAEIGEPGKGFDTLQISFWACPSYHALSGTNKGKISSASGTTYAKYIEIGTCTDPADPTTYTVLQGWTYEVEGDNLKSGTQADAGNDYAFRKVTVKLNNATGPYVFIRPNVNRGDGKSFTYSTMYIDDLQFEKLLNCEIPTNPEAVDVMTRNAKLQWSADALTYAIEVSTDPTFTDPEKTFVSLSDLTETSYTVSGLEPATSYYFRVKAYCDAAKKDASDWTSTTSFTTPYAPLYSEEFTTNYGEWSRCYGYANKVFAGKAMPRDTTLSSTYNCWYRVQNLAMSGYAVRAMLGYAASANPSYPISSTYQAETYYQKYWLISPSITLEQDSAQLTFMAALTNYTTADPITVHSHWNEGWDDQFMVIVSEDDGKTWKKENATIWNNETSDNPKDPHYKYGIGQHVLTEIPATPTLMTIDLDKYKGKTIRVAFYAENTDQNAMNSIHVDNIRLNYRAEKKAAMTLCQYEDVEDVLGFYVNGDTVSAGRKILDRSVLSAQEGVKDSMYVLDVNYLEAPESYYEMTVCAGHPFEYMGFNEHSAPGMYRMKLQSVVTGCDSIVNFRLKHAETFRTTIDTTICYGSYYTFNGEKLYETCQRTANFTACDYLGGCDSVVTLNLTVTSPINTILNESICEGSEYYWKGADTTITTAGTYQHIFPAANGCDSVVTMTMNIIKPARGQRAYEMKEGGSYQFGDTVLMTAGVYERELLSLVTGCDSIDELTLTIIPAPVEKIEATICGGTYYEFAGNKLTQTGIYRDTTYEKGSGYMSITELSLEVIPVRNNNLGTKYIRLGDSYEFYGRVLTEMGIYYDTVPSIETGCDSVNFINLIVLAPATGQVSMKVCSSDLPIKWKGMQIEKAGTYQFDTLTTLETDSIILLTLEVIQPVTSTLKASFCEGGSYELNGKKYNVAGTYYDTVTSKVTDCDSIITLILTREDAPVIPLSATMCAGKSYEFGGKLLTKAGIYRDTTYAAETHCMEIHELQLSEIPAIHNNLGTKYINSGDSYDFYGKSLTETGIYYDTVASVETGCDSINYMNLVVLTNVTGSEEKTVCPSELPITWKGMSIEKEGTYQFDTLTVYGTDSVVILSLSVTKPVLSAIYDQFCEGGSYVLNGKTYTDAGTYYDTLTSKVTGCDSIIALTLVSTLAPINPISAVICAGDTYAFGKQQLSEPGVYRDTTYDADNHCMSIDVLMLDVNSVMMTYLGTKYINKGDSYDFYGKSLTENGVYYDTVKSVVSGCDSVNYIVLNTLYAAAGYTSQTVCSSELPITWKGMKIEKEGTYQFDTLTVHGTDSIIYLTLDVIQPVTSILRDNFCEGGSYVLNGKTFTSTGTYFDTVTSKVTGCDSIITLVLTITPAPVTPLSAAICDGASYEFAGKQLTKAGIYRDTTYAEGSHCMEIQELTLSINYPVSTNIVENICAGDYYEFGGEKLTETGLYSTTIPSVVTGCDSTINLALNVAVVTTKSMSASICKDDSYSFGGKELTEEGVYFDTLRNVYGCDSLITTLNLSVNKPTYYEYSYALCAGGTYDFYGTDLSEAGDYTDTIANLIGCDSIVTVHLTINEPLKGAKYAEYCGESYLYEEGDGNEYKEGTYEVLLKTNDGCDSIVTLTVKQTFDVHDTLRITTCAGEIYSDEHFTVDKPGTYYYEEAQAGGCTMYYVLYFENYPSEMSIDTTVLLDDLEQLVLAIPLEYKAQADSILALIEAEGDYSDSILVVTPQGCDFTIYITLHVKEAMSIRDIYEDENGQKVLKVLYRDHLYIIRQDGWYSISGQKVQNPIR